MKKGDYIIPLESVEADSMLFLPKQERKRKEREVSYFRMVARYNENT